MTVAIYRKLPEGMLRLGTMRVRKHYSIRAISAQYIKEHPHCDPAEMYIANRVFHFGRWMDSERIPFDYAEVR